MTNITIFSEQSISIATIWVIQATKSYYRKWEGAHYHFGAHKKVRAEISRKLLQDTKTLFCYQSYCSDWLYSIWKRAYCELLIHWFYYAEHNLRQVWNRSRYNHFHVDRCYPQLYRITFTKDSGLSSCVIEVTSVCLQFLLSCLLALTGVRFRNLLKASNRVNFNALKLLIPCLSCPFCYSLSGVYRKCPILSLFPV